MEQGEKKAGMSKGCLVGLIIGGVVLVLIVIVSILFWVYKDDLAKFGTKTIVLGAKDMIAANPPEDLDTVQFNAMVDEFVLQIENEPVAAEQVGLFMSEVQEMMSDKEIDAQEVQRMMTAMRGYFPSIHELGPAPNINPGNDSLGYDSTVSQ